MSAASPRFLERAAELGVEVEVAHFPSGTRTADEAAAAVGCDVAQIVKSLVFVAVAPDGAEQPILALTSGANRADTDALARTVGAAHVRKADAEEARAATGYAIGGTPPFGHATPLEVLMDETLLDHEVVWAAAGTPMTVFPIAPDRLRDVAGATLAAFGHP